MLTQEVSNKEGMTGYPSIDKPWLKYYTKEQINAKLPRLKAYDYIYIENKAYPNDIAFNYYGRKITYSSFFQETEKAAKAFLKLGIHEGDIVAVIAVSLPEVIYSFYGLNRIGAVANMIDPRTSAEGIREYIEEADIKTVVVIDLAYEKIVKVIQKSGVKNVIVVSPADSLPQTTTVLYRISKGKVQINKTHFDWYSFIENGKEQEFIESPYRENECCVIVHTGGTTGVPKG